MKFDRLGITVPGPQVEAPSSHLIDPRVGRSRGQTAPRETVVVLRLLEPSSVSSSGAFCASRVATRRSIEQTLCGCPPDNRTVLIRGGLISAEPRINDRIRVPEVRLVGPSGEQVGIVPLAKALELAQEYDLDLVEVAATARPPVCKLMDYGKFKYESAMKAREARKNQAHTVIKEMKLRPKIDPHDYDTKKGHVVRFLKQGDKVKITIMFRGREQSRPELGFRLLQRLAEDVQDLGFVESNPKQDGRNMIMVLGPHKKKTEAMAEAREAQAARKAERQRGTESADEPESAEAPEAVEAPEQEPAEA